MLDRLRIAGMSKRLETVCKDKSGRDTNVEERAAAAEALGKFKDPSVKEALLKALGDESGVVRAAAICSLGSIKASGTAAQIINALADDDTGVRVAAAKALGDLDDPAAIEPLVSILGEIEWKLRMAASEALYKLGETKWMSKVKGEKSDFAGLGQSKDPRALQLLINALSYKDDEIRLLAVNALRGINDAEAIEPLAKSLKDKSIDVRKAAIEALGEYKVLHVMKSIMEMLNDASGDVRKTAAEVLGGSGLQDQSMAEALIKALGDSDGDTRKAAADGLNKLDQPEWKEAVKGNADDFARLGQLTDLRVVEPLIKALSNKDKGICEIAAKSLGELKDQRAVQPLIGVLCNPYPFRDISTAAAKALAKIGDLRAVRPLIDILSDRHYNTGARNASAQALGELGDRSAIEPLTKAIADGDGVVRKAAIEALGKIEGASPVTLLIDILSSKTKNVDVRMAATELLGRLRNREAIQPLVSALIDKNRAVSIAAANALVELGEPLWKTMVQHDITTTLRNFSKSSDPRAAELIARAIDDYDNETIRSEAISSLAATRSKYAAEPIIRYLGDNNENVSITAVKALGELMDSRASEPLIKALEDERPRVRMAAVQTLGKLADMRATEPLIKSLTDADSAVRCAAANALDSFGEPEWKRLVRGDPGDFERLGRSGDIRLIKLAKRALDEEDPLVCAALAGILAELNDKRLLDLLIIVLEDADVVFRAHAANVLGRLNDRNAVKPLTQALADGPSVRLAAAKSLFSLGEQYWLKDMVKGDDDDFFRLGHARDLDLLRKLVKILAERLDDPSLDKRSAAARVLIDISKRNPSLGVFSDVTVRKIEQPHRDEYIDRTSDCSNDGHRDYGIGIRVS